jgi:hypothetical protein
MAKTLPTDDGTFDLLPRLVQPPQLVQGDGEFGSCAPLVGLVVLEAISCSPKEGGCLFESAEFVIEASETP